jgi:putative membrane protein
MDLINTKYIVASLIYSLLGIVILIVCFVIIEKIAPENLWKELIEKQNTAIAIVAAALILAIAIIVSSAIHG